MNTIEYLRIFSDDEGCSHFETKGISLEAADYAPPTPHLNTSTLKSADNSIFLELPIGWCGDWHLTPVKQWVILMTGECEFEAADGEIATRKAGEVVLLDDTTGKGHKTKVLGNVAVRIVAIHFS